MTTRGHATHLDLNGLSPDEAFSILGNDIRLDVIRVLWEADAAHTYDDGADAASTISYSALRAAVDVDDNGKFNYHLSRLSPHFVRRTEEGYRLSGAGKQIARTVIAVSGPDDVDVSAELEEGCPLCGAALRVTYDDGWLRVVCSACEGLFGDEAPTGTLFLTSYPAAGLADRPTDGLVSAALYRCALDITYLLYGICRECGGGVSSSVSVCEDHAAGSGTGCTGCGTPFRAWAEMQCETCGFAKRLPVAMFLTGLVTIVGSAGDRFVDGQGFAFSEAFDLLRERVETRVATDPVAVTVSIATGRGTIDVVVDDEMNIVEFERARRPDATA